MRPCTQRGIVRAQSKESFNVRTYVCIAMLAVAACGGEVSSDLLQKHEADTTLAYNGLYCTPGTARQTVSVHPYTNPNDPTDTRNGQLTGTFFSSRSSFCTGAGRSTNCGCRHVDDVFFAIGTSQQQESLKWSSCGVPQPSMISATITPNGTNSFTDTYGWNWYKVGTADDTANCTQ